MSRTEDRMTARLTEITRAAVDRCATEIPFYRALPRDLLDGEVHRAFTETTRLIAKTLREERAPDAVELTEIIDWSARRAADGLPLDAAIAAYLVASMTEFELLSEGTDAPELRRYAVHTLRYLASVLPAVALAHLHEQQQIEGQRRDLRRDLVAALLSGEPAAELAEQSGITLAPGYLVVLLRLAPAEPGEPDVRRTVRRVQSALDAHQQTDVLTALTTDGGTVLLPRAPDAFERLPALLSRIGAATARPVTAAAATADTLGAVPDALAEAEDVAALARRLHLPPGLYRLDDVLVEYQLARPGRALARLAAKLEPLAANPVLLETARTFVRHGRNRSRTAAELRIHRNTLDYRLGKIAKLTGLDLSDPDGMRILDAAVTARALL
ncbi:PucR family transcriptional regulator [Actinomadura violacea]|uniref:Helix-turn-helix domain-containing protein n=1 Tax=Actinomadura violacea TaxID=2819934 RepID=A0ABS3RLF9_9ACTN|nr:helix-turn-helix domain-containing protein [Actinomadura violacea]MBO2457579.1 helix-turn-helix domain-containing protein [Actinomadura violacea]